MSLWILFFIDTNTLFRGWFIGCKAIQSLPFFCFGLYLKEKKWTPMRYLGR